MVAAALVGDETKVPFHIISACSGATEMNHRCQLLFLLNGGVVVSNQASDLPVEQGGGQFHGVAWDDSAVEAVEPTGVHIVPRPILDDHMVVDAIALPFLKRAVGDLKHADGRGGRSVPLEGILLRDPPLPVGARHGIARAFGLGDRGEQFGRNDGRRMDIE